MYNDLRINAQRLEDTLRTLGAIAQNPENGGRNRLALSDGDKEGRDLFCKWMKEDGLEIKIDEIGNIFGIKKGTDPNALPIMLGSHLDTVKDGGMFDGAYGVLGGLEVIRTLKENKIETANPIVVAVFTNEEGARFQLDMMGSRYYATKKDLEKLYSVKDDTGVTVKEELKRIGYLGNETVPIGKYFELHIEQGPRLYREGISTCAVEGIQGLSWWKVEYQGQPNHAGSTPMEMRKDALLATAKVAIEVEKLALKIGNSCVATIGRIHVKPDIINIVPGSTSFTIDLRQFDKDLFTQAKAELQEIIKNAAEKRGLKYTVEKLVDVDPVIFDKDMVDTVEKSAKELGLSVTRKYSAACHDAQFLATICPTAMIFVPSLDGKSHCPEEWTDFTDIANGCNVLLHSVLKLV
ncbi:MAG: Zn-dependent hydrolase [Synergistaceae bacterium]